MRTDKLEHLLFKEVAKRQLIQYFETAKGFKDDFDRKVFPPAILDIGTAVPVMAHEVEVVPFVQDADPIAGIVNIGWNLFVSGQNRMYLGVTSHDNATEFKQAVSSGIPPANFTAELKRSPREIIKFVMQHGKFARRVNSVMRQGFAPAHGIMGAGDALGTGGMFRSPV